MQYTDQIKQYTYNKEDLNDHIKCSEVSFISVSMKSGIVWDHDCKVECAEND